jgi:hypothetical protein
MPITASTMPKKFYAIDHRVNLSEANTSCIKYSIPNQQPRANPTKLFTAVIYGFS